MPVAFERYREYLLQSILYEFKNFYKFLHKFKIIVPHVVTNKRKNRNKFNPKIVTNPLS